MHDANGTALKVGDRVMIPARIRNLSCGTLDYCNVTVESTLGRRPDEHKEVITLNTGVMVKISGDDKPVGL